MLIFPTGIAFGFIVMSNALVAAEVSGACFNPAVAMLALLHGKYVNMWVYVMGPLTGSFLAWVFFRLTNPSEYESKGKTSAPHISIDLILVRMSFPPQAGSVGALLSMLAMEFIGTFMIAWVVALSLNVAELDQCIAIGTAVTAVVYTGGAVSGGHFNPCVTLGVGMIYVAKVIFYVIMCMLCYTGLHARKIRIAAIYEVVRCRVVLLCSGVLFHCINFTPPISHADNSIVFGCCSGWSCGGICESRVREHRLSERQHGPTHISGGHFCRSNHSSISGAHSAMCRNE